MSVDYYKVLGVERNADENAIKKAYRKMAMKYHPDKNQGDKKAEEKFKEVSEAYEILSDGDKKAFYDRNGFYDNQHNQRSRQQYGRHPADIFASFMNGGSPFGQQGNNFHRRMVNPDNKFVYQTNLKTAIMGGSINISINREIACEECKGKGVIMSEDVCDVCGGQGRAQTMLGNMIFQQTCNACGGSGKKHQKCGKCNGQAYTQESIKVKLKIPAGIRPMSTPLKIKEKGNVVYVNDKQYTGDVYVMIDYPLEQDGVRIDGQGNIHANVNVPFNTIISGSKITVDILGCKKIEFGLKSNTKTGQQYRIKGKGTKENTHAFIKVFMDAPENDIDEEVRERVIKTLEEAYGKSPTTFNTTAIT